MTLHIADLLVCRPVFLGGFIALPIWFHDCDRSGIAGRTAGAGGRRRKWYLADAGGRRQGACQQMRRRSLWGGGLAERPDRSRNRESSGRRQESQSLAG